MRPVKPAPNCDWDAESVLRANLRFRIEDILGTGHDAGTGILLSAFLDRLRAMNSIVVDDVEEETRSHFNDYGHEIREKVFVRSGTDAVPFKDIVAHLDQWYIRRGRHEAEERARTIFDTFFEHDARIHLRDIMERGAGPWRRFDMVGNKIVPRPDPRWIAEGRPLPDLSASLPVSAAIREAYGGVPLNFYMTLPTLADDFSQGADRYWDETYGIARLALDEHGQRRDANTYARLARDHAMGMPDDGDRETLMGLAGLVACVLQTMDSDKNYPEDVPLEMADMASALRMRSTSDLVGNVVPRQ